MSRIPQLGSKFVFGKPRPQDEVPELPRLKNVPLPSRARRSKSFSDLRSATMSVAPVRKPLINMTSRQPSNMTANTTAKPKLNVASQKAPISKPIPRKVGIKRVGENTEPEIKNKVVRRAVRVPEWDYKTRFANLNETYTTLVKQHEMKLAETNEIFQKNADLQEKYAETQSKLNELQHKHADLQRNYEQSEQIKIESLERITLLERDAKGLEIKVEELEMKINVLEKTNEEIETKLGRTILTKNASQRSWKF
ncbi:hypothetical protein HHI36_015642 [Cryptolaemus montrouzieri]|uniref:Uncharacterized protein n=1 Tax=Cryptolaemus montrouzieri TaxID=559131 RepID=A0ABD2N657_9CUCU